VSYCEHVLKGNLLFISLYCVCLLRERWVVIDKFWCDKWRKGCSLFSLVY